LGVDTENNTPVTGPKRPVVYSCSGCSDAGELADRIARTLNRSGAAEMSCIVGVGGGVKPLVRKAQNAERILAIDGCPLNCVANTLRKAGINNFEHLELQTIGFRKGSVPVTDESIGRGVEAAEKIIDQMQPEGALVAEG
jgi:uncharacterized metal-binding protein